MKTPSMLLLAGALALGPGAAEMALAQTAPVTSSSSSALRPWIVAGGGYVSLRGDCATCEGDGTYRSAGGILADIGVRVNPRVAAAAELFWVPTTTPTGEDLRATFLLGIVQARPWSNRGFFLKGGMGLVFVRNWVYSTDTDTVPAYTTTGLGLTYGAGWVFQPQRRVTLQIFGAHHVLTFGDLTTAETTFENIVGNAWSVGAGLVFR